MVFVYLRPSPLQQFYLILPNQSSFQGSDIKVPQLLGDIFPIQKANNRIKAQVITEVFFDYSFYYCTPGFNNKV